MSPCFVDTFCFLALLNSHDNAHSRTMNVIQALRRPLVTTEWIFTELADGLATTRGRALVGPFIHRMRSDPRSLVVPASSRTFEQGMARYVARHDKDWSLTDCISFIVMEQRGITDALTADHHFEQAGFTALLK
jgi:predicted nucleic acid-binding protein